MGIPSFGKLLEKIQPDVVPGMTKVAIEGYDPCVHHSFVNGVVNKMYEKADSDDEMNDIPEGRKEKVGIYVDLASFFYGTVCSIVKDLRPPRNNIDVGSAVECICQKLKMGKKCQCGRDDDDDTRNIVILTEEEIENLANHCVNTLRTVLGELFDQSVRLVMAWDTCVSRVKNYEQLKRDNKGALSVNRISREQLYNAICKKTKSSLANNILGRVLNEFPTNDLDEEVKRLKFIELMVMMKMGGPIFEHVGQKYTIGEGEWKCMYQLRKDVEENYVDRCYVLGNDWDIGMSVILYSLPAAAPSEENSDSSQSSPPQPQSPFAKLYYYSSNSNRIVVAIEKPIPLESVSKLIFSSFLLGNDYVNRLISNSEPNLNKLRKLLFSNRSIIAQNDIFKQLLCGTKCSVDQEKVEALSKFYTLLLMEIYNSPKDVQTWTPAERSNLKSKELIMIESKEKGFVEIDYIIWDFTVAVLWYLNYIMFGKNTVGYVEQKMCDGCIYEHPLSSKKFKFEQEMGVGDFILNPNDRCKFTYHDQRLYQGLRVSLKDVRKLNKLIKTGKCDAEWLYDSLKSGFESQMSV